VEASAGFEAGPIQWPYPERIEAAPLVSFGYEGKAALLVRITPPRALNMGERVILAAQVSWLECAELQLGEMEAGQHVGGRVERGHRGPEDGLHRGTAR
jgi:DsbC/DsbD-like thiol-disulfide interchange protein